MNADTKYSLTKLLLILALAGTLTPTVLAGTAAVSMPDRYGAEAAENILTDGGNAVDAAVAAAFVLAVTYPEAGNIGGGGFMVSYMNGESAFLDFRERAPGKAHRDMYLDEGGNVIPNASLIGGQAVGVPGTVRGMQAAHDRYGSLPWMQLLQPAIRLAREGFTVPQELANMAADKAVEVGEDGNFSQYFGAISTGQLFRQPDLARTLEQLAANPGSFYTGITSKQIVRQMEKSGGLITLDDLRTYRPVWREPLQSSWRNYTVLAAPPPSSGGFALVQLLAMRDHAGTHFRELWHNSPTYVHLLAEIEKRVFADRAEYLGDPDFVSVPLEQILAPEYLANRSATIDPKKISPPESVPAGLESTDTTHFSILDHAGNAVSLTYTLNWEFGSGVVVEGAGFLLNNQMDDFSAKPGVKNKFGVIGNTNNAIAPGKRMLSSMSPTILLEEGTPALIVGTPGGSTIFTTVFQVILNLYDFDMPLQAAVDATRYHHQLPDAYLIRHDQREIPADTRTALEAKGYTVQPNSWGNLGRVEAIKIDDSGVQAASDIRGRGETRLLPERP